MSDQPQQAAREVSECASCHQQDADPKHTVMDAQGGQLVFISRHFDCCRSGGCPDGSCARILADVGELRGAELIGALTGSGA